MAKAAKLTEWRECGFVSRVAMEQELASVELGDREDRDRFYRQVLTGTKEGFVDRLNLFKGMHFPGHESYRLQGPAAIGVSGGRTSGYMLYKILEAFGGELPPDVLPIFQNTGKERDETIEFLHQIEVRWSVPLIWLEYISPERLGDAPKAFMYRVVTYETAYRDSWPDRLPDGRVRPFNALFETYTAYRKSKGCPPVIPNVRQRICTAAMKIKVQYRYLRELGWDYWDGIAGIRADEPRRVANARLSLRNDRAEPVFPLNTAGVTEADVMAFWGAQEFDLGLNQGEGNCDLCFLKSVPTQLALMHRYPERAQWWMAREDEVGDVFRRDLSRNIEGPRGYRKMLKRAQALSLEDIDKMRASGIYPDSLPCSCTD